MLTNEFVMRGFALLLFALAAVLGSSLSCSPRYGPLQVTGPIGAVHFPDPWVKVIGNSTRGVNDNVGYVIRKSKRAELIFAIKCRSIGGSKIVSLVCCRTSSSDQREPRLHVNGTSNENASYTYVVGEWDRGALMSISYRRVGNGYEADVVRGWVGKPELKYPEEFWKGLV